MPAAAPPDADFVAGLRLGIMRLARRLRQQADGEVTPSLLSALASVERLGPLTLGELAAVERVQPPTVTKLVARLEELGFVVREADQQDRRVTKVRLAEGGKRYIARSRTRKDAYLAERLQRFTPEERAALAQALPLLERLAGEEAPS
ncbi:MAG: MarR family transcriptional regulator [Actinobacteria bacterium]|nr:MarR family transcriptional regulator [Actinomycetota bacterium]MBW3650997.1 MarR family transcriptional regulator [Actinomycetota bacterium]